MVQSKTLRIGLLVGGASVPAWVAHLVKRIHADGHAKVVLLVTDASPPPATVKLVTRLKNQPRQTLENIVRGRLEKLLNRVSQIEPELPDAFAPVSLDTLVPDARVLKVYPQRTLWSDRLSDAEVSEIKAQDLDVLIRVGFRILRGGILTAAKCGVWSFHHGDNDDNRGGPPGYWESMQAWDVTGCTLQWLSEDLDNGLVLAKTWSSTNPLSVADNNRSSYWKSLSMVARQLAALARVGHERFVAEVRARQLDPNLYSRRLYRAPGKQELLTLLMQRLWRRIQGTVRGRLGFDQWILLFHFSEGASHSFWRYKRLVPPKDRFWADPFLLTRDGRHYVFYEELMFSTGRGHIAVAELRPDGQMVNAQRVIVEPHHLSYPFVFEHEGQTYMVPESKEAGKITLYRCVEMPGKWEKVHDLMDNVQAVDATLHPHEGRWWMFVNMVENAGGSSCDELFIFHADSPLSRDWVPHPMNPVVSDVRRARPAGKLFTHEGRLYRPSQNCGPSYGWGFNFSRVDVLSPTDYREVVVSRCAPEWSADLRATHTFNREGPLHIIDAQIRRSRWS